MLILIKNLNWQTFMAVSVIGAMKIEKFDIFKNT